MANGRPGDHPYNDIVRHREDLLGGGMDDKIRRIDAEGSPELIKVASELVASWPHVGNELASPYSLAIIVDALIALLEAGRSRR
jgi:hypothetical protein